MAALKVSTLDVTMQDYVHHSGRHFAEGHPVRSADPC